ncbi:MAG: RnfABCDGE type electron transport complex subunit D [Oscillospiraceae bacterium]
MSKGLIVSASPHIRDKATTSLIMRDVLIALVPALLASVWLFGIRALMVVAACVIASVLSEYLFERICHKPVTVGDLSAAVTGVLLGFNLPVGIPLWIAAFGGVVAVAFVKQLFGGIGQNFANPAITARIVLLVSFTGPMTTWINPGPDAVAGATPLAQLAAGQIPSVTPVQMLLGMRGGCLGETCSLALIAGGIYLLFRKVISWHIPVAFIGTVFVLTALAGQQPVYQVLSGGLLIGAIFMATDYTTSPATPLGKLIFGVGCGGLTVLIRLYGSYPEGVSYAILLMNILEPHISTLTQNKAFGGAKG